MKTSNQGKKKTADELGAKSVSSEAGSELLEIPEVAAERPAAKAKAPLKRSAVSATRGAGSQPSVVAKSKSVAKAEAGGERKKARKSTAKVSATATSPVKRSKVPEPAAALEPAIVPETTLSEAADPLGALSPVDRLLAQPELPTLERENRARLQMQTPTRLYFYWSVKENPWALLRKAFGDDMGSYTLILKLVELRSGVEEIHKADPEGNWWFDVRPDGEYQAEIGFYAPNRPYFRIVYSNIVETPRKKPSPRRASEADWTVTADRFSRVLDVAGFSRDAFDVALAGDDVASSRSSTRVALDQFTGGKSNDLGHVEEEDIRYAMLAFAAGQKLDDLRWQISPDLFAHLEANEGELNAEKAQNALKDHFEADEFDLETEDIGPAVFGSSLVNFPRTLKSRRRPRTTIPGYKPESSHSYRGFRRS